MALDLTRHSVAAVPSPRHDGPRKLPRWQRPSGARRRQFTEQLALLLETGMPLVPAITSLAAQSRDAAQTATLQGLIKTLEGGGSLADAMAVESHTFPTTYVTVVRAAEQGGFLQRALRHLLDADEQRSELSAMLLGALAYPAFLVVFSLAVVVFVLTFVFPRFADLFAGIANELPWTTVALMAISGFMVRQLWWLGPLLVVLLLGGGAWLASPAGALALYGLAERLPLVRDIVMRFSLVQTMRTLSLSLSNGVTLVMALDACREVVPGTRWRHFVDQVLSSVRDGRGMAVAMADVEFLPALTRQMLATGEEAGQLAMVAGRIADHYQLELKRTLGLLGKVIEPLLLLVMGAVVGLIVSSLILPIFKLARAVH